MGNRLLKQKVLMTLALMTAVTLCCSSCETLKKKFTRKKKASQMDSIEAQPVLEPQEYLAPERNPIELYKQHYALIKSWYRDLWAGIDERGGDASVKYSIKQITDHLEQMKLLFKTEKAKQLDQLSDLLKFYQTSLEQPRAMRNYSRIQSDLRVFDRTLRSQFRADVIKADLNG